MSRRCSSGGRSSKKVEQHQPEIEAGEVVVLVADECHLLAGDASGYGWGRKSERLTVQMTNAKERQSYFGALNAKSGTVVLSEVDYANSHTTVGFLETLQKHYTGKQVWVIWDVDLTMTRHRVHLLLIIRVKRCGSIWKRSTGSCLRKSGR